MSKKRARPIDSFFVNASNPTIKRPRSSIGPGIEEDGDEGILKKDITNNAPKTYSSHPTYPFPIAALPPALAHELNTATTANTGRPIVTDGPDGDLDLVYFEPFIRRRAARQLFEFLRAELPFYRVEYDIVRRGTSSHVRTPRWTTVFGLDDTSCFSSSSSTAVVGVTSDGRYRASPRPLPRCLEDLRLAVERALIANADGDGDGDGGEEGRGEKGSSKFFNFCLVNYYASGADSIAFHSDDERFLGARPTIASLSLGATRDFLMKRKPPPPAAAASTTTPMTAATSTTKPLKLPLAGGDMVVMRGATQANWLHSVPKRGGRNESDGGRINITFRRARVKAGTENYYNYNVGTGPVYRWDAADQEMKQWKSL
ncbi:hypothetical protein F5X99DRAFT_257206 [Biscogniauxia marginata]|nr:hypothetical protein F5X99DRAFT_257206 [Biscogniauxia marginata]